MQIERSFAFTERDELDFQDTVIRLAGNFSTDITRISPHERPLELTQLINEEIDCFQHYSGEVLSPDIGDTQSIEDQDGIRINLRHFYPDSPGTKVGMNERGQQEGTSRLVPASLLSKDLKLAEVPIGRFLAGITKYNSIKGTTRFCCQILVLSVCGKCSVRTNLTFQGHTPALADSISALSSEDFNFVSAIFHALEKDYGDDGLEFLGHEVARHRRFMSRLVNRELDMAFAFDAYVKQFGGYMATLLEEYKEQVVAKAKILANQ